MTGKKKSYSLQVPFDSNDLKMVDELQKYYLEEMQLTISKNSINEDSIKSFT